MSQARNAGAPQTAAPTPLAQRDLDQTALDRVVGGAEPPQPDLRRQEQDAKRSASA